jgi:beta-phosphoglucomutase-like phosphatase (HAD superfamily)
MERFDCEAILFDLDGVLVDGTEPRRLLLCVVRWR